MEARAEQLAGQNDSLTREIAETRRVLEQTGQRLEESEKDRRDLEERCARLSAESASLRKAENFSDTRARIGAERIAKQEKDLAAAAARERALRDQVKALEAEITWMVDGSPGLFDDIVTESCWIGSDDDVRAQVKAALKDSPKFQSVRFHDQDSSGNMYFVCEERRRGNQQPKLYLLGINSRRRKVWSSLYDRGRSM